MKLFTLALQSYLTAASALRKTGRSPWEIGQVVNTTSGSVQGHAASIANTVSEYLGIPYGKPTAGNLRFAAPVAYTGTGSISGANYSADCPINPTPSLPYNASSILYKYSLGTDASNHTFSEDCLSINVWTKPQVGEPKKAVMLWIYGGGFTTGTSNSPGYNGATLAEDEDVVVVTFNYRTNFFGFAAPPGLPNYNFGLLDQRLAVKWVFANIAAFGGDPDRITLFGQSAGGASVDIYSYAWTEDPIINAFIPESGATGVLTAGDPTAVTHWYNVSQALGCGTSAAQSVACVRNQTVQAVLNAVATVGASFVPVVDNVTIFSDYAARGAAGKFIKRPILVGNNNNEAGLFNAIAGGQIPPEALALINADFTCPAGDAARYRTQNGVKAWRYRYFGVWPNLDIGPDAGTFHSAEVPQIFGNAASLTGIKDTPTEKAYGDLMRGMWAAFAKNPDNALSLLGLPTYNPSGNTLIELAFNDSLVPRFVNSTVFDTDCANLINALSP